MIQSSSPTDVLAESLDELDRLDVSLPQLMSEPVRPSVEFHVVRTDDPVLLKNPSKGLKRVLRRDSSSPATLRREAVAAALVDHFRQDPTPRGCSDLTRLMECEGHGVGNPNLWTDVFDALHNSGKFCLVENVDGKKRKKFTLPTLP